MTKPAMFAAMVGAAFLLAGAAGAQQNDRKLIIYGDDKCPAGTICVHAPEADRYRIPQTLRTEPLAPQERAWSSRQSDTSRAQSAISGGTGSCSANGAGGWTGCWNQMMKQARDDRRQKNAETAASPEPR